MHITQLFVVLLLLGWKASEVAGNCSFNETQSRCTCSGLNQENIRSLIPCLPASIFELQGGNLEQFVPFASTIEVKESAINVLQILKVTKIIFRDLLVPEVLLAVAMRFVSHMHVTELEFERCTFLGNTTWFHMNRKLLPVLSLRFHNVTSPSLADRGEDFSSLSGWLDTLQNLTVTQSQVIYIPCSIGKVFSTLRYLDVSENRLLDQSIRSSFCQGAFPQLRVLKLHRNNLSSFQTMCEMLFPLKKLTHLDLSQNYFTDLPTSSCEWQPSLRILNLSTTGLDYITMPLPPNIEVLDLSSNNLHFLDLALPFLKQLYLSNNRLSAVPTAKNYPALEVLSLDGNLIQHLPRAELQSLRHLQNLWAGRNHYSCSCTAASEIQTLANVKSLMPDWPQDYICESPSPYQGTLVQDVPASVLQCNNAIVIIPISVLVLSCLACIICYARCRARSTERVVSNVPSKV